ncbi:MAG: hypothetical protein AAFU85_05065 [Planctomycetota bacterium]
MSFKKTFLVLALSAVGVWMSTHLVPHGSAQQTESSENAPTEAERTETTDETSAESEPAPTSGTKDMVDKRQVSLAAFAKVATVLRHPRCLNCHPSGDRPHVGDDRKLHGMNVQRGPENHGMPGLHCGACHRTENQEIPNIPGTPHWQLAPRSMGWEGLDDRQLAQMLIDKERNGNRSFKDLMHHMGTDPLVLWGWKPGDGRSIPPLSHEDFMQSLKTWLENGAAIPHEGETTF